MNSKRILLISLVFIIILSSLSIVSAGWFDFMFGNDPLINESSFVINYHEPVKSDEYAYYYKDTGEYAGPAHSYSISINITLKYNVHMLYKYSSDAYSAPYENETYFNELLKEVCDEGKVSLKDFKFYDKNNESCGDSFKNINGFLNDTHAQLSEDGDILIVTSNCSLDGYTTTLSAEDIENIKNITNVTFTLSGMDKFGSDIFHLDSPYSDNPNDPVPVTINKLD